MAAKEELQKVRDKLHKLREESKHATATAMHTALGTGSAFGIKWLEHRYPDKAKIMGMDLSLVGGLIGTVVGAGELAGDAQTNDLALAAGQGMLYAYAAEKGATKGNEAKAKADSGETK